MLKKSCVCLKKPSKSSFLIAALISGALIFMFFTYLSINLTGYSVKTNLGYVRVEHVQPRYSIYPKTLEIYDDTAYLGKTPTIYPLKEGKHTIIVKKYGFTDKKFPITIKAGVYTDILAELNIKCTDSDKGVFSKVQGTINSYKSKDGYLYSPANFNDYCFDSQSVMEFYCGKQSVSNRLISCNNGCADGKCI